MFPIVSPEKTLFITDLDGTLLGPDGALPPGCAERLNALIAHGANITVATARAIVSATKVLRDVAFALPLVLMNGVLIWDCKQKRFEQIEALPRDAAVSMLESMDELGLSGFLYEAGEDRIRRIYHTELNSASMRWFKEDRSNLYTFTQVDDLREILSKNSIYMTLSDDYIKLKSLYDRLLAIPQLRPTFYSDIYASGLWWLEIFSSRASKGEGVRYLREKFGFGRVVCFGDNLNDLPLFEAGDVKYAVADAEPRLRLMADGIVESGAGVVGEIERIFMQ